jgi:hypothetical protein
MTEPPLADFPTACSQMHDHDPIDCAPETIAKTVDIPVRHVVALLATIACGGDPLPDVETAVRDVAVAPTVPGDGPDTWRVNAETAWWLAYGSDALGTFDLDETANATYHHPAIVAEIAVQVAVMEQAPDIDKRLSAYTADLVDAICAA